MTSTARTNRGSGNSVLPSTEKGEEDFYTSVANAAKAAYDGDPVAQLTILRAMQACQVVMPSAEGPPPPPPTSPDWKVNRFNKDRERCARLRTANPFSDLPQRPGGYSDGYWIERADESGAPLAQSIRAMGLTSTLLGDANFKQANVHEGPAAEQLAAIEKRLESAARGGDPSAYLYVGLTLGFADGLRKKKVDAPAEASSPDGTFDPRQAAWLMLSCRQSADCDDASFAMLDLPCPVGVASSCEFRDALTNLYQTHLTPAQFAQAEALSHEIQQAIQDERWTDIDLKLLR
ncbi:MAG: hypothetical protein WDO56_14500 [Gammaproteobacteria bacterium]